ncbi:glycosyltransferase family 8 protein [Helicobacter sp. 23-1045]
MAKNQIGGGQNKLDSANVIDSVKNAESNEKTTKIVESTPKSQNLHAKSYPNLPLHFHLITDTILPQTKAKLKALEAKLSKIYPLFISTYHLSQDYFKELGAWGVSGENYCAYFRLKMGDLLPQNIYFALYLDSDVMCASDVREIFHIDLGGNALAMAKDAIISNGLANRADLFDAQNYCNSGVMLIDMTKYRAKNMDEIFALKLYDQDFLNYKFKGQIKILPFRFNFVWIDWRRLDFEGQTTQISQQEYRNGFFVRPSAYCKDEIKDAMQNPLFIHFAASYKPWEKVNWNMGHFKKPLFVKNPFDALWWRKARKTPFYFEIL